MLASISGAKNVLEIGTFTGYSALCFAEGINQSKKINKEVEKEVVNVVGSGVESKVENEVVVDKILSHSQEHVQTEENKSNEEKDIDNIISSINVILSDRQKRKNSSRETIKSKIESKKQKIMDSKNIIEKKTETSVDEIIGDELDILRSDKGSVQGSDKGSVRGSVVTCEMDPSAAAIALQHFKESEYRDKVNLLLLIIIHITMIDNYNRQ